MKEIKTISIVIPYNKEVELKLWFQKRKSKDNLDGLSEFPGGKIEANELPVEAAVREFKEEVGISISEEDLELFKIHKHSSIDNFIFYIFGLNVGLDALPFEGWSLIKDRDLNSSGLNILEENYVFMKDILKTL